MTEMLTRYSKGRADIADHTERLSGENATLLARQRTLSQASSAARSSSADSRGRGGRQ